MNGLRWGQRGEMACCWRRLEAAGSTFLSCSHLTWTTYPLCHNPWIIFHNRDVKSWKSYPTMTHASDCTWWPSADVVLGTDWKSVYISTFIIYAHKLALILHIHDILLLVFKMLVFIPYFTRKLTFISTSTVTFDPHGDLAYTISPVYKCT